jgi:hypothetical protein
VLFLDCLFERKLCFLGPLVDERLQLLDALRD